MYVYVQNFVSMEKIIKMIFKGNVHSWSGLVFVCSSH